MMSIFRARPLAAILFLGLSIPAAAAPFTPASDSEVVERLPAGSNDPRCAASIRCASNWRRNPTTLPLRLEIARRYFDLAMAQGDPRYVGYASAAIAPLAQSAAGNAALLDGARTDPAVQPRLRGRPAKPGQGQGD